MISEKLNKARADYLNSVKTALVRTSLSLSYNLGDKYITVCTAVLGLYSKCLSSWNKYDYDTRLLIQESCLDLTVSLMNGLDPTDPVALQTEATISRRLLDV